MLRRSTRSYFYCPDISTPLFFYRQCLHQHSVHISNFHVYRLNVSILHICWETLHCHLHSRIQINVVTSKSDHFYSYRHHQCVDYTAHGGHTCAEYVGKCAIFINMQLCTLGMTRWNDLIPYKLLATERILMLCLFIVLLFGRLVIARSPQDIVVELTDRICLNALSALR